MVKKGDSFTIQAQFYAIGAGQGEDALTNPTTPRVSITGANGAAVAGSPFAMAALPVAITGIRYYTLATGGLGDDQYAYVCYDAAEPTPTITHSQGWFSIEDNDMDDLASAIDAVPTAVENADQVWDEPTAGHAGAGTTGKALTDILAFGAPPTVGAMADAVLDEAISGHATAGTVGAAFTTLIGYGAPPSANAIADQVHDEVMSGHVTAGTFGGIISRLKGPGAGATVVTKDSGGSNNLRPTLSGVALQGVRIEAYLTSDYAAGISYATYGKGSSVTDVNGDFTLLLGAGAYTLLYYRLRSGSTSGLTATTTTYTVS